MREEEERLKYRQNDIILISGRSLTKITTNQPVITRCIREQRTYLPEKSDICGILTSSFLRFLELLVGEDAQADQRRDADESPRRNG